MDPQAALVRLRDAILETDDQDIEIVAAGLAEWLRRGSSCPPVSRDQLLAILTYIEESARAQGGAP